MHSERIITGRARPLQNKSRGIQPGKISDRTYGRRIHYGPINYGAHSLRYSARVGLEILGGRMPAEFKRECNFMERIYDLALEKENKDYTKIKELLDDIATFSGYINGCKSNPKSVPPAIVKCLPDLRKKLDCLESRIKKTLETPEAQKALREEEKLRFK